MRKRKQGHADDINRVNATRTGASREGIGSTYGKEEKERGQGRARERKRKREKGKKWKRKEK